MITRNKTIYALTYSFLKGAGKGKVWERDSDHRRFHSMMFYGGVRDAGNISTPYTSLAASALEREPTPDHFLSPRLVFLAMMDQCREVLKDREKFYEMMDVCRHTVKITSEENNSVKYKPDKVGTGLIPIVTARTVDKYDSFGWVDKGKGLLTERKGGKLVNKPFPLKHMIPDWLTAFEEKCMKHHGFIR